MKIIFVADLSLPGVKVIRFERFLDLRGYFTEPFRRSDIDSHSELECLRGQAFVQANESHSRQDVVRGLHFQWAPPMGKLVRTVGGHMVDVVVDIRKGSPTLGKGIMHDMPTDPAAKWSEWIWIPPGFAHGNFFPSESTIEYYCTAEYNQHGESAISPLSPDIDWSLCEPSHRSRFAALVAGGAVMSDKDRQANGLQTWLADPRSDHFRYPGLTSARG